MATEAMGGMSSGPKRKIKTIQNADRTLEYFRDEHGVPHITASSWHDALFGLGYMHATDRTTQILF